jgi:NDP-sugar pyrophosphorylase family protein/mevalonate kinase
VPDTTSDSRATSDHPKTVRARAHARVGLLGNPSDLYGGKGLGFAVRELSATVEVAPSETTRFDGQLLSRCWALAQPALAARGVDTGARPFAVRATSDIPFQSGLSGSSAILIAAIRAWCAWYGAGLSRGEIAHLAWRVENDLLGIRAGPLDRLVQSHEGLVAMDFRDPWKDAATTRLDPALLPPILLAWHGVAGTPSGDVHAPVFRRWQEGDAKVRAVMDEIACNSVAGRAALESRDLASFMACVNRNLDLRAELFAIEPADRALADLGRRLGAATKLPGSGGAVLFVARDEAHLAEVEREVAATGATTLRPTVARPTPRVRAVFLAAGFATRLYPLTLHKAKPLLEVGGTPMMTRILGQVEAMGAVTRAAVGGGMGEEANAAADDAMSGELRDTTPPTASGASMPDRADCEITDGVVVANGRFHADFVAWEREVRGARPDALALTIVNDGATANENRLGAVRDLALALEQAPARDDVDAHLVLACDNLFDFDLARLARGFATTGRGQLVVREVPEPVPSAKYSEVTLDESRTRVARFREKPANPESNLSAIAVYLLPRELPALVDAYLDAGGNPDAPGHFIAWLSERVPLAATPLDGKWIDIGSAEDLARAGAERGSHDEGAAG